mgnify:CR=1 FL=1
MAANLAPFSFLERDMSLELAAMLYASLGLALAGLRLGQGMGVGDALFGGLFWPLDLARCWIELTVRALLSAGCENP